MESGVLGNLLAPFGWGQIVVNLTEKQILLVRRNLSIHIF